MAFGVPDEATASYTDQAELDSLDLAIITAGFAGTGVYSGCAVTAQSVPDGTVDVTSGSYRIGGSTKTCAGGTISVLSGSANPDGSTATAADADYFRYDLIVADNSDDLGVVHGTLPTPTWPDYSVNPVFPTVSASQAVLAAILIPPTSAGITGVQSSMIVRKDLVISVDAMHDQAHSTSGANHVGDLATTQMPQLSAWSTYINATSSTADPTTAYVPYIEKNFAKQGLVVVTTESDTPPPFRWYNRTGRTLTFSTIGANATIGPSGSTMTIDVNVDGTTIMTGTKVVLPDNSGAASAVTQTTFSTTTVADGHYVSINVDTAGGGAVQNLLVSVWLKG